MLLLRRKCAVKPFGYDDSNASDIIETHAENLIVCINLLFDQVFLGTFNRNLLFSHSNILPMNGEFFIDFAFHEQCFARDLRC